MNCVYYCIVNIIVLTGGAEKTRKIIQRKSQIRIQKTARLKFNNIYAHCCGHRILTGGDSNGCGHFDTRVGQHVINTISHRKLQVPKNYDINFQLLNNVKLPS